MWEEDDDIPEGALPLTWISSPGEIPSLCEFQPRISLVCEECEADVGILWSEIDSEVLCFQCCQLLYPKTSSGDIHYIYKQKKLRFACQADRSSAQRSNQTLDYLADVLTAEKWEELGRDLRKPSAVEAPKKNPINSTSRSNRPLQKFTDGDIVVFDVEDQLPTDIQGHARLPPWRNREIWGRVMGTAHPRLGQYGHAIRDGDEHEPYYRVQCMRWVNVNSNVGEGGKCNVYAAEMLAADDVFEQRHLLDRKKEQLNHGFQLTGFGAAPFARERSLAWIRDRQIKISISMRNFAFGEMKEGAQADATSFPTVVLLSESNLWAPAEKRASLVRRRAHQCHVLLRILDGWLYERGLINSFFKWIKATYILIEQERDMAARKLQKFAQQTASRVAMFQAQVLLQAEQTKGKHSFHFLQTDEEKRTGFTTDNKRYFATLHECSLFNKLWQEAAGKTAAWIQFVIRKDRLTAIARWRAYVVQLKKLDRVPVTHLGEGHVGNEVAPLGSFPFRPNPGPPWHPAIGIDNLPALPRIYSHKDPTGNIVVIPKQQQKFNSYRASTGGPSDTSNWVIPGKVLTGAYPEGKARRRGRQPTPPSALSQILLSGVGTIVCIMAENEKTKFEKNNDFMPIEIAIGKEHQHIRSWLKGTAVKMEAQASTAQTEVAALPVYSKSDQRYEESRAAVQEAVARERLAFAAADRAKLAYSKVPSEVKLLTFELEEGEVPAYDKLIVLLESIEARMRSSSTGAVYVFSRKGHGRSSVVSACLLGRLYGIRYNEVLERIQSYHDSRSSVIAFGRAIPALQTVAQASIVQQVLAVNDTLYGAIEHREGKPTNETDVVITFPKLRGRGVPVVLPPQQLRGTPKQHEEPLPLEWNHNSTAVQKPMLRFPKLHCPNVATNRDLRFPTVMEEEVKGPGIARTVRELVE